MDPQTSIDEYFLLYTRCNIIITGYPTSLSNHSVVAKQLASDFGELCSSPVEFHTNTTTIPSNEAINIVSSDFVPLADEPWDVCIFILTPPDVLYKRGLDESQLPDSSQTTDTIKEYAPPHTRIMTDNTVKLLKRVDERYNLYYQTILPYIVEELAQKNVLYNTI